MKYHFFWDGPFSQWYSCDIIYKDIKFGCAEQAMMYSKAILFGDEEIAEKILNTDNPRSQKALGRQVRNFDPVLWDQHKFDIVLGINLKKFDQNLDLKETLLNTDCEYFVEASPYDTIWGIGLGENDPRIHDESQWRGQNLLGKALDLIKTTFETIERQ
jgi:ribA/ribD-fused uncharacterized protein